ncbi:hypothetical protein GCM10007096_12560 [Pullulanibacillus pueri]|uniref:Uncharacterized protein n=1 Tax=Pullulanibacillus pueri TaxID=1437324 RepID=A0A8J2ZUF2_9BACL|nr:hypothetical protein GCM10007096_12560 [Pullulanibacillus pueri]
MAKFTAIDKLNAVKRYLTSNEKSIGLSSLWSGSFRAPKYL